MDMVLFKTAPLFYNFWLEHCCSVYVYMSVLASKVVFVVKEIRLHWKNCQIGVPTPPPSFEAC